MLGDGMADYPVLELGDRTPLQAAVKPGMDFMAKHGELGLVKTVPDGMPTGSDTANLAVMGFDPKIYYTGRSPIEAVSMGIELLPTDVAYRLNLVTLSDAKSFEERIMLDYSADEISTEEAKMLISALADVFGDIKKDFYPGISYRHCLVLHDADTGLVATPPHDILTKRIGDWLPSKTNSDVILHIMRRSCEVLENHPVNKARIERGLKPANAAWLWGEGRVPALPLFEDKYGLKGSVVSAVDLIKGIGILTGLRALNIPGATGNIHTNFEGKAEAALAALREGDDFVYIHVEAPDECGHRCEIPEKVRAIELIDEKVLKPVMKGLEDLGEDYAVLLVPDHPTPLSLRTHTGEPVPYCIYRSTSKNEDRGHASYDEAAALSTGVYIADGYTLMDRFIRG